MRNKAVGDVKPRGGISLTGVLTLAPWICSDVWGPGKRSDRATWNPGARWASRARVVTMAAPSWVQLCVDRTPGLC